jgi:hypothetical protein
MSPTVKLEKFRPTLTDDRPVVLASLGCHVQGAAMPHPDPSDAHTAASGALYRFCREIENADKKNPEFEKYVDDWLIKNMEPLPADYDLSFETWLKNTPYKLSRKEELRDKHDKLTCAISDMPPEIFKLKGFTKDECYPSFKHARAINSRSDEFKTIVGPVFQAIGEKLFARPEFIKKIPINERPDYIMDTLFTYGSNYTASDFTSFEAHFDKNRMLGCEMKLLQHMIRNIPDRKAIYATIRKAKLGKKNHISFKNFVISILGKRMSGEMDTSLSNGFSNLMFLNYLCQKNGNTGVKFIIEGDDAIGRMAGSPPKQREIEDFGLSIKLLNFKDLNHASFCGMIFDLDDRTNVTDPISELVKFGWTSRRYALSKKGIHMNLLRSKALSLAYQYPHCPILCRLALKISQLTASYDVISFVKKQKSFMADSYKLEIIEQAIDYFKDHSLDFFTPKIGTRLLVENLYGVSISDQLEIEKLIDSMTTISVIDFPVLQKYFTVSMTSYSERYIVELSTKYDIDNPGFNWPKARPRAQISAKMQFH